MFKKIVTLPGVPDPVDARATLRNARKGDMACQAIVSFMYLQGIGFKKSERKAYKWMLKSAEQGNAPAMHSVSIFLRDGIGVSADSESSLEWMKKSADIGYHDSQLVLGNYYAVGVLVPKDLNRASKLLRASADQGNPMAKMSLGMMMLFSGDDEHMDVDAGISLLGEASDSGCVEASEVLSTVYLQGQLVPENTFLGHKYIRKAAEQGSPVASLVYGSQLLYGSEYTQKDQVAGFNFLLSAYDRGIEEACPVLGEAYLMGIGTEVNPTMARKMFEKGIANGSVTSATNLGVMYMRGIGVDQDVAKAEELLTDAYSKGSCAAACNLGAMYAAGEFVERDPDKSREWYLKAAEMGEIDVSSELEGLERDSDLNRSH